MYYLRKYRRGWQAYNLIMESVPIIRNSVISNNTNGGGNGGGMVVFNTALDMDGCILNNASRNGAGVYIDIDESGKEAVIKNSLLKIM